MLSLYPSDGIIAGDLNLRKSEAKYILNKFYKNCCMEDNVDDVAMNFEEGVPSSGALVMIFAFPGLIAFISFRRLQIRTSFIQINW